MSHCSKCTQIILADTEDWDEPLCYSHWHQHQVDEMYIRLTELVNLIAPIYFESISMRDDMKEIISVELLK